MAEPIIMPRQGQSVESCILTEWKVTVGDQIAEGDVLAVIETDKASFDLESTAAGTVLALFWEADDDVPVLANVAVVGNDGEDVEEFRRTTGVQLPPPNRLLPKCLLPPLRLRKHLHLPHRTMLSPLFLRVRWQRVE